MPRGRSPKRKTGSDDEAADPEQRAWSGALGILARREMGEQQVRKALLAKGHPEEAVAAVVRRLLREKLVDDGGLAARYARSRLQFRGQGQHRIRQGLRQRGVAGATIEAGIREALGEVDEGQVLERLARRYWTQRRRDAPERRLRALWAFLLRRGFPAPLVHERLRKMWPRWSDALEGLEPFDDDRRRDP